MGTLLRHGSEAQKQRYLPRIASGQLRLQAFGVSEPNCGTDTLGMETVARKEGDEYVITGTKLWTSRAQHSDLMLLLARTAGEGEARQRKHRLSAFLVDMRRAVLQEGALTITPVETMINHSTCQVCGDAYTDLSPFCLSVFLYSLAA